MSNPSQRAGGPWSEEQLAGDVEAGLRGARVGAFFDFDGTVIDGYSLTAFARHHLRSLQVAPADLGRMLLTGLRGVTSEQDFERFTELGMRVWAGRSEDELDRAGRATVGAGHRRRDVPGGVAAGRGAPAGRAHRGARLVRHPVPGRARGQGHGRRAHHRLAGGDRERDLHRPCPEGRCCGGRARPRRSARSRPATTSTCRRATPTPTGTRTCRCCGPSGRARAVNPGRGLAAAARHYGWPVARFRSRGRPGAADIARTAAGLTGLFGGFAAGLVLGAPTGSRREAVDLGITLAGELGSVLAGVRLDVTGAEYLAARPAVFLFNHQSQLDVLILAKLLRGGFTGVAKKELATAPGFGLVIPARRRGVRRPRQYRAGTRGPRARRPEAAQRDLAGDRAGGHPVGDAGPGAVQEGRVPRCDAGGRACRAHRHPQLRRADVAERVHDPGRQRPDRGPAADPDPRLDARGPGQARARGPPAVSGHAGRLAQPRVRAGPGHRAAPARPASGNPARLGHLAADEPAGDGDVAGRGGRQQAAGERQPARAARPRPRLGPAARRARVGLAHGAADARARGRAVVRAGHPHLGQRRPVRPFPACPPSQPARPRLAAPAPGRGAGLRRRPVRQGPPAVGSAAGRGAGRRPGRIPGQEPSQRDRRARRGAADHPAAQPHARARPAPARAAGGRAGAGIPGRPVHRADGRVRQVRADPGAARGRRGAGRAAAALAERRTGRGTSGRDGALAGPHGRPRPARFRAAGPSRRRLALRGA